MDFNEGGSNRSITSAGIPSAITKMALCVFCAVRSFLQRNKRGSKSETNFTTVFLIRLLRYNDPEAFGVTDFDLLRG
jgi:hypothetical protein